jgi:hypothetical protein
MTLYDLQGEYKRLYDLATDEDDPQALADTLECLDVELMQKGNGYAHIVKMLEMEEAECDRVIEAFTRKREIRRNAQKRLKQAYMQAMEVAGKDNIACGEYTLKIKGNGGLQPLKITGDVPANFMRIKYEPDNELIRKTLAEGKELNWAHLEPRGKHLEIK